MATQHEPAAVKDFDIGIEEGDLHTQAAVAMLAEPASLTPEAAAEAQLAIASYLRAIATALWRLGSQER